MIKIVSIDFKEIEYLRNNYLTSLPWNQELFLELMLEKSSCYLLFSEKSEIGYVVISDNKILIEFYLAEKSIPDCSGIFKIVIAELSVSTVYCKSFDYLLLSCCMMQHAPYKLIGALYRDRLDVKIQISDSFTYRTAQEDDLPFLLLGEDGLYETQDELVTFVRAGNVLMFYDFENFVGCGFLIRVHQGMDYYDIGMWIHPDHRKKGFATQIIAVLKETCLNNNWKPSCGCAIENIASQKTLEKCGFISKHKMIEFKFTVR